MISFLPPQGDSERVCELASESRNFEQEPGRTADPSAALGMTKGRGTLP